jgi:hypothetical protein
MSIVEDQIKWDLKWVINLAPFKGGMTVASNQAHTKEIFQSYFPGNDIKKICYEENVFKHLN